MPTSLLDHSAVYLYVVTVEYQGVMVILQSCTRETGVSVSVHLPVVLTEILWPSSVSKG
jgi:hypothetical protein